MNWGSEARFTKDASSAASWCKSMEVALQETTQRPLTCSRTERLAHPMWSGLECCACRRDREKKASRPSSWVSIVATQSFRRVLQSPPRREERVPPRPDNTRRHRSLSPRGSGGRASRESHLTQGAQRFHCNLKKGGPERDKKVSLPVSKMRFHKC